MNVLVYELIYRIVRFFNVPISRVFGPHEKLHELILSLASPPGRALDLGCGDGRDAIFLARSGFDVTAVDFAPTALNLAQKNARKAGVDVEFLRDDVTNLRIVVGAFDLILDIGAFNDIDQEARDAYVQNLLPHTRPGCRYLLMCFDKKLSPGELPQRFGEHFEITSLAGDEAISVPGIGFYYMERI